MAEIVYQGSTKPLRITNRSVSGVTISGRFNGTTNNQNDAAALINLGLVIVTVFAKIGGQDLGIIVQGRLDILSLFSNFQNSSFEFAKPTAQAASLVLLAPGSGNPGSWSQEYKVDFGQVINLANDDELRVEINFQPGALGADINSSTSYLEFDFIDDVGVGKLLPSITVNAIEGGQSQFPLSCGDFVSDIFFINLDKQDILLASAPIISFNMQSKEYSVNKDYLRMVAERNTLFETIATSSSRWQCFPLFANRMRANPHPVSNCSILLQLTPANITSAQNYIVVRRFNVNNSVIANANRLEANHAAKNLQALGVKSSVAATAGQ